MDIFVIILGMFLGILSVWVALRTLSVPSRYIVFAIANSFAGMVLMCIVSILCNRCEGGAELTPFSSLMTGIFGIPSAILIVVFKGIF